VPTVSTGAIEKTVGGRETVKRSGAVVLAKRVNCDHKEIAVRSSSSSQTPVRIAPDTNIASGLAKRDLPSNELLALGQIAAAVQDSHVTIWATTNVREELLKIPEEHQAPHFAEYNQWREIPGFSSTQTLSTDFRSRDDVKNIFEELRTILPDENDARLTAAAYQARVRFVVTCDVDSFRKHAAQVEAVCAVQVPTPSEVVAQLVPRSA
jgi:predicted nucleic acid-binding protein